MNPRVGHIEFSNCHPLYYGLNKSGILHDIDLIEGKPTELAKMLNLNALDIASVPSFEYGLNYQKFTLLPDISVSSDGEVKSILLVSKKPINELDSQIIALTSASATSQVLLKIILTERYGVKPIYYETPGLPSQMLAEATAALIIGDDALGVSKQYEGFYIYDLGFEWKEMTGKKMVYAVWAVRDKFIRKESKTCRMMDKIFGDSIRYSKQCLAEVAEYSSRLTGLSVPFIKDYFDSLRFDLSEPYKEGLMLYYKKAYQYGYLQEVPKLKFIS
jgi:chorismate dehydratase